MNASIQTIRKIIENRLNIAEVAVGQEPSDLVISGAKVIDVNLGTLREADIAIKGSRIAYVGDVDHTIGPNTKRFNATGKFISPGLIDAHMHFESSFVTPLSLANTIVPRGNTAIISEPHDWANVFGLPGMQLLKEHAKEIPLRFFMVAPAMIPLVGDEYGSTRGVMGPEEVSIIMKWPEVLGIGKVWGQSLLSKDQTYLEKISSAMENSKRIGARFDYLEREEIQAILCAGIGDMYTVNSRQTAEDMYEWVAAGLRAIICEGSTVSHAHALAQMLKREKIDSRYLMLCTYDRFPLDVQTKGYLDNSIRILISEGIDPVIAIRMATLNTAEYFGL